MFRRNDDDIEQQTRIVLADEGEVVDEADASVPDEPDAEVHQPQPEPAAETAAETAAPAQPFDRAAIRGSGPYRSEGCVVFDARGRRVCICGHDGNRTTSGPALAEAIASLLNRL